MRGAVGELAAFCHQTKWPEVDAAVQARTRELLLDLVGVTVGGCQEPSSLAIRNGVSRIGGLGAATIIGAKDTGPAAWAALANGAAAHALELDDVTRESSLHPGAAVIPAAIAVAEEGAASPTRLLGSIIIGYEIAIRVGNALNAASAYARGFHPTGVAGIFGATAAVAHLLELNEQQIGHALAIAGTMASGSLEYLSDGAWTKRLNPGWAAHAGIVAANLASCGFTGPTTALEGRLGFLRAYSDQPRVPRLVEGIGDSYEIMRVSVKPYACCRYNHGLIDGVLRIRAKASVTASRVVAIKLGVLQAGALLVAEPIEHKRDPQNVVDAQFSAPFAASIALVRGDAGRADYTSDALRDPEVRRLMSVTDCYTSPRLDALYPAEWPAEVQIEMDDGQRFTEWVAFASGEPENPLSRDTLLSKFKSLVRPSVGSAQADLVASRLLSLDAERNVADVLQPLRFPPAG